VDIFDRRGRTSFLLGRRGERKLSDETSTEIIKHQGKNDGGGSWGGTLGVRKRGSSERKFTQRWREGRKRTGLPNVFLTAPNKERRLYA